MPRRRMRSARDARLGPGQRPGEPVRRREAGSKVVPGWGGGVGAAGGGGPAHDAGLRLAEFPAGGLLAAVVPAAQRCQPALAGAPGRVGQGVVQVAEAGLGAAAGRRTADGAGADQVAEQPAGGVAVFLMLMVAGVLGDRVEGEVEPAQQVVELRRLGGVCLLYTSPSPRD